jgi:hypothetical protein
MLALKNSSNAIDFEKAVRSDAYASFKEFDGQSLRGLIAQHLWISARFEISDQTAHPYIKLRTAEGTLGNNLDFILRTGNLPGVVVSDDDVNEPRENIARGLDRYFSIGEIEGRLQLVPACSFWRIARRAIFEDYKTVLEIPRQLSGESQAN